VFKYKRSKIPAFFLKKDYLQQKKAVHDMAVRPQHVKVTTCSLMHAKLPLPNIQLAKMKLPPTHVHRNQHTGESGARKRTSGEGWNTKCSRKKRWNSNVACTGTEGYFCLKSILLSLQSSIP
jgi:hypothetical protein